ncbi:MULTISPECIES: DUF3545 family protein [Thalassotalea]|uniref:DUF3545 family protein n=1 Tax=Thalassotalea TaxID=1518149 RepID=UPI0011150ACF|nr:MULTISPECIES: DUF3545 family protein [Thalassotalea]
MNTSDYRNFDYVEFDELDVHEVKAKVKTRKRKWREIENIKEVRRLRKELAQYDSYEL